jgi:hypothetical protein
MARRDAVRIPVKGELYDGATDILIAEAKAGRLVVRLSVNEVSLEETVSVASEGISFETVPAVVLPKPAEVIPFPVREDIREDILRAAS